MTTEIDKALAAIDGALGRLFVLEGDLDEHLNDARACVVTLTAQLAECREAKARMVAAIPTSWLDPLLTGPNSVLRGKGGTWDSAAVERLLSELKYRLAAIAAGEMS